MAERSEEVRAYHREYQRSWRAENRELSRKRVNASAAKRRAANPRFDVDRSRVWKEANPDKVLANHLWRNFRMRLKQYYEMLASQNGVCANCGGDNDGKRLCVDHDHAKPKGDGNRWLLCSPCNLVVGNAKESPTSLRKMADMLERYHGNIGSSI